MKKSVSICYLGNPDYDTRVNNLYESLVKNGYKVNVIGFDWRNENSQISTGAKTIYRLRKTKFSLLFYLRFAVLLSKWLLKSKSYFYFAEDVYTLPFVTFFAGLKGAKVIYNSRELYMSLAGLRNKPRIQKGIAAIEKMFIHKTSVVLTTGDMDTEYIKKYYNIKNVYTIRNLPNLSQPDNIVDLREKYNLPGNCKILLYQGVLFEGRGIGVIIKLLKQLEGFVFVLLGIGEYQNKYEKMAEEYGVSERVIFAGAIEQGELKNYTAGADIGVSLIENISESYYYALPNKLFEYIMAGLPVIVSDLPQMKKVVEGYNVGAAIDIEDEERIIDVVKQIACEEEKYNKFKNNCASAAEELNCEKEFEKLYSLMEKLN